MVKKLILFDILISLILLLFCINNVAANELSEAELYNKANEYTIGKDFSTGIETLKKLLSLYPDTRNEDVYWKFCEIYDNNLYDYENAIVYYKKYLLLFPQGRFCDFFKERLTYLETNKDDWSVIKEYRNISDTYYTRNIADNVKLAGELLKEHPQSVIVPDLYNWLAMQYFNLNQNKQMLFYAEKYLATFPENGKSNNEHLSAYKMLVTALQNTHKYGKAIEVIKEARKYKLDMVDYKETVFIINKEKYRWTGFCLAVGFSILMLILIIILRPWQEKRLRLEAVSLLKWFILLSVFTIAPFFLLRLNRHGLYKAFYLLTITSCIALIASKMLSPIVYKVSPKVFQVLSFLLSCSAIYIAYYLGDTLSVFYQKPGF